MHFSEKGKKEIFLFLLLRILCTWFQCLIFSSYQNQEIDVMILFDLRYHISHHLLTNFLYHMLQFTKILITTELMGQLLRNLFVTGKYCYLIRDGIDTTYRKGIREIIKIIVLVEILECIVVHTSLTINEAIVDFTRLSLVTLICFEAVVVFSMICLAIAAEIIFSSVQENWTDVVVAFGTLALYCISFWGYNIFAGIWSNINGKEGSSLHRGICLLLVFILFYGMNIIGISVKRKQSFVSN